MAQFEIDPWQTVSHNQMVHPQEFPWNEVLVDGRKPMGPQKPMWDTPKNTPIRKFHCRGANVSGGRGHSCSWGCSMTVLVITCYNSIIPLWIILVSCTPTWSTCVAMPVLSGWCFWLKIALKSQFWAIVPHDRDQLAMFQAKMHQWQHQVVDAHDCVWAWVIAPFNPHIRISTTFYPISSHFQKDLTLVLSMLYPFYHGLWRIQVANAGPTHFCPWPWTLGQGGPTPSGHCLLAINMIQHRAIIDHLIL